MDDRPKRVAILGHRGFIGRSLLSHLAGAGHQVEGASSSECNLLVPDEVQRIFDKTPDGLHVVFCNVITPNMNDHLETTAQRIQIVRNFVISL